jgi:hypothetical protein
VKHAGSEQSLVLSKYIHRRKSPVRTLQAKIQTLDDSAGYYRIREGGLSARLTRGRGNYHLAVTANGGQKLFGTTVQHLDPEY